MLDKVGTKWAEIDLDAVSFNIEAIKRRVGPRAVMAVVKADAYGHGAVEIARCAEKAGVRMLGVSSVDEGIQLRENFIDADILILGAPIESQSCDIINYNLTPTVSSWEFARRLNEDAGRLGRRVGVHICVDTGMGRVGPEAEQAVDFVKKVMRLENLEVSGIYSHFSSADEDYSFSHAQLERFTGLVKTLDREGIVIPYRHIANSAAVLELEESYFDMVRTGLLLYGIYPYGTPGVGEKKLSLKRVLSLKARVVYVKEVPAGTPISYGRTYVTKHRTRIATLPLGYADGFLRSFSNTGEVLIRGKRFTVSGNVCMDMMMVDVGRHPVERGDEAVIIGAQGKEEITVYEMARKLRTIPYEVISLIGKRVPRLYFREGRPYALKKLFRE